MKPQFSEGQLQILCNMEIADLTQAVPIIPSLRYEHTGGYDTKFSIPNSNIPADAEGYNFFVQYKLAELITKHPAVRYQNERAIQWAHWNENFFSFNFHWHKNYQQRDTLADLSALKYLVVYIANHTLSQKELTDDFRNHQLKNKAPVLQVSPSIKNHRCVSFTNQSNYFLLTTEPEQKPLKSVAEFFTKDFQFRLNKKTFGESLKDILDVMNRYQDIDNGYAYTDAIAVGLKKQGITWFWLQATKEAGNAN